MTLKKALEESYKDLAPYSNRHSWEFFNNLRHIKFILKHVPKGSRILDIGSGIGILALALTKFGYKVDGLDKYIFLPDTYISLGPDALEKLQEIWQKNTITIFNKDVFEFEANEKYDCVINIAVIEHQRDPKKFLAACSANLKVGGYFFCVTPNMVDLLNRLRVLVGRSAFRDLKPFFESGEKFVGHWREYTLDELKKMCYWSSLTIIEARNYRTSSYFNKKNSISRSLFLTIFRLIAIFIPGSRDTNSIMCKK
jgi:2-polyprenyl-3-methyl-5-hydroxy-6-metoxy-1,4-benzoquinol methylase